MAWPGTRFSIKHCCACAETPADCEIDSDTFDGDLSKWHEVSGAWATAGGLLQGAGAGTLLLLAEPALATDGIHLATNAERTGSGDPSTLRLFAAYDDADNYIFGELEYNVAGNSGTIRVGKRMAGIEAWLSPAVTLKDDTELADPHDLAFCWNPPQAQDAVSSAYGANPNVVVDLTDTWENEAPPGTADVTFGTDGVSEFLDCSAFGLVVPPGSTINGIGVGITAASSLDTPNCGFFNTVQLFGPFGTSSNLAVSTQINDVTFELEGFGGQTELWGVALTPEDIMDVGFGVTIKVEANGTATGGVISLGEVIITVWYTGPDKTPGRVTLNYTNTETGATPATQCAVGTTQWETTGKGVGIRIAAGDWDFTHFTASYLDSPPAHTPCPTCTCSGEVIEGCVCCDAANPASVSYVVDLGAGGWADDECNICDEVAGEYVLEFLGNFGYDSATLGQASVCVWKYEEAIDCGGDATFLTVQLELRRRGTIPDSCDWILSVTVGTLDDGGYVIDRYRNALGVTTTNCTGNMPLTLSKVTTASGLPPLLQPCGGSLPGTAGLNIP